MRRGGLDLNKLHARDDNDNDNDGAYSKTCTVAVAASMLHGSSKGGSAHQAIHVAERNTQYATQGDLISHFASFNLLQS